MLGAGQGVKQALHHLCGLRTVLEPRGLAECRVLSPGLKAGQELSSFLGQSPGFCLVTIGVRRVGPAASVITKTDGFLLTHLDFPVSAELGRELISTTLSPWQKAVVVEFAGARSGEKLAQLYVMTPDS